MKISTTSMVGAIIVAIATFACCVGPLLLLTLGVSVAWTSNLSAIEPFRPLLIGLVFMFLGFAFWKLYFSLPACEIDKPCGKPQVLSFQRKIFWIVAVFSLLILAFPWYASLLY